MDKFCTSLFISGKFYDFYDFFYFNFMNKLCKLTAHFDIVGTFNRVLTSIGDD